MVKYKCNIIGYILHGIIDLISIINLISRQERIFLILVHSHHKINVFWLLWQLHPVRRHLLFCCLQLTIWFDPSSIH